MIDREPRERWFQKLKPPRLSELIRSEAALITGAATVGLSITSGIMVESTCMILNSIGQIQLAQHLPAIGIEIMGIGPIIGGSIMEANRRAIAKHGRYFPGQDFNSI